MSAAEQFLRTAFDPAPLQELAALLRAYGLTIEEHDYHFDVACEQAKIWVDVRPVYCNRGRFLLHVETIDPTVLAIDWADGFPRYYFGTSCAAAELVAWMAARCLLPEARR